MNVLKQHEENLAKAKEYYQKALKADTVRAETYFVNVALAFAIEAGVRPTDFLNNVVREELVK